MKKHEDIVANSKWLNLIKVVTTPLGFYTLVALLINLTFGIGVAFTSGKTQTVLAYGMPIILIILIGIVICLAIFNPHALLGKDSLLKRMKEKRKAVKNYQLESIIEDDGAIILPENMKNLIMHRVKLTLVDLEPDNDSPVNLLADITQKYTSVNEEDLDIASIYEQREQHHDRGIVFD